jgi:hypothetical protein
LGAVCISGGAQAGLTPCATKDTSNNNHAICIACHLKRRIFERRGAADQLSERIIEIALLFLVFPGEETLPPDVREAVAAAGLSHTFFEHELFAHRIGSDRALMPQRRAKIEECACAAARSVSATGFHFAINCWGVIGRELPVIRVY